MTTVLFDNVTLTAGAADQTSTYWIRTIPYRFGTLLLKVTNGAAGPTVTTAVQVRVSTDVMAATALLPANWYNYGGPLAATLGNNVITSWAVTIYPGVNYVRVIAGSNTVQNVTIRAEMSM
jgi:hypothetical protein